MRYQNPHFLYFLFAIAIPILIHLFNLRKHKTVYFSNVSFLKEIKSERRKKNHLKQILILISRILALSAIILAFSRPYIPLSEHENARLNTFIYIDNSFSMDDISSNGRLLDVAKEKSIKILDNLDNNNNFWIVTNDLKSTENISKNKEECRKYILNINNSSESRTKFEIIEKIKSINTHPSTLFLISDFQKSFSNIRQFISEDSLIKTVIIPLEKDLNNNVSIDSCYFKNTSKSNSVISSLITNHSDSKKEEIVVKLEINNQHKTQQVISLLSGETKEIELNFIPPDNTSNIRGIISIEDHPISFDNKLYFSYQIENNIKVCQIYETENHNIKKLFSSEENIQYSSQNINQLDLNSLKNQNLVIINEITEFSSGFISTLKSYIEGGGSVCIIPCNEMNSDNYNSFLSNINTNLFLSKSDIETKISELNLNHPIFNNVFSSKQLRKDIDLSSIYNYYHLNNKATILKESIYKLENGDEFLNYYSNKKGEIYLFTSPLSEGNNFSKHALFVTTLYNMALHSVKSDKLYYTINKKSDIKLKNTNPNLENIYHLKSENTDIIADYLYKSNTSFLSTHDQIKNANHYELTQENQLLQFISFNYSREESNTEQHKEKDIINYINSNNINNVSVFSENNTIIESIKKLDNNKEYWKLFVLLSLVFITSEILLIKKIQS